MQRIDNEKLDKLILKLESDCVDKKRITTGIISIIRSASKDYADTVPVIDHVKSLVESRITEEVNVKDIADEIGISYYYMCHLFKKITGITVTDYRNEIKISKAKQMLINTDANLTEIAQKCGFSSSSYFSKMFIRSEKISPSKYRQILKH